jgi:hypothetical protein
MRACAVRGGRRRVACTNRWASTGRAAQYTIERMHAAERMMECDGRRGVECGAMEKRGATRKRTVQYIRAYTGRCECTSSTLRLYALVRVWYSRHNACWSRGGDVVATARLFSHSLSAHRRQCTTSLQRRHTRLELRAHLRVR